VNWKGACPWSRPASRLRVQASDAAAREPRITRMGADRNESIMLDDMIHEELSGKIIGAAMSVLNALKPGLDEKLYENALVITDCKNNSIIRAHPRNLRLMTLKW